MMKVKYYTCPVCKQKYKSLSGWGDHMDKIHPNERPEGYSTSRFFYMVKTGKTSGKCRTCKGPTEWNEVSMKYAQFCTNPKCKEAYVKIAKERMRNVYGKEYILDDPNIQKKMLSHRKISGFYTFQDGGKIGYVGSYERKFLMMLDTLFNWPSNDIIGPSPHVYYYDYKNKEYDENHEGRKFYIPDYYIPSLNLEIEIKQQTSTNQEFNKINRVKEKLKDEIMNKNKKVNYLKINDNDFRDFFAYLEESKKEDPEEIEKAMESCMIDVDKSNDEIAMESNRWIKEEAKLNAFNNKRNFEDIDVANEWTTYEMSENGYLIYPSDYKIESLRCAVADNGMKNGIIRVKGIPDQLRYRAEMLIVKDGKLFINLKNEMTSYGLRYTLPGGGVDQNEDPRDTAIRESQEEVRMNVANVKYAGSYVKIIGNMSKSWKKHHVKKEDRTTGSFTVVFIGTYFSKYDGKIEKEDKSDMIKTGKFIPIDEVYDILEPIHQEAIREYYDGGLKKEIPYVAEAFSVYNDLDMKDSILPAYEGFIIPDFFKRNKSENSHDSWSRKIFQDNSKDLFGRASRRFSFKLIIRDNHFELHGLSISTLSNRIKKFYKDRSIYELFIPEYNKKDLVQFNKKRMKRSDMRIEYLKVDTFFAIELVCLFNDLGERFRDKNYLDIAKTIYAESWLAEADKKAENTPLLSTKNLKKLSLTLNDYQQDFIEKYPKLKAQLHLKGYILAFEQGLGKTLTAISLAECLEVDHVYIVCPNSLKANWALEIRKYYKKYEDEDLWRQEVFICGDRPTLFSEHTTKFIITNNESIEKMYPYVMSGKNMLILDESHNFRNINSKRVTQLIELRDKLRCEDSLIMSGTPIKATPDEIVPALMMIDPTFSVEAAKIFAKAFKLHSSLGTSLVQTRFNKIMFRKEKDTLGDKLPQKFVHYLPLHIKEGEKYLMSNVNETVTKRFGEIYDEGYAETRKLANEFYEMSEIYKPVGYDFRQFKRFMRLAVDKNEEIHELDKLYVEEYMSKAKASIRVKSERDRYDYLIKKYARYKAHCLGLAFGEILPPYRRDMFISLYEDNRRYFINAIESNVKKTLIFTQFKGVANFIHQDLNKNGVQTGLITGDVKDRLAVLKDFKDNDRTRVLVATSQTIGTGVTLTEANQMFFFGPPWRDSDFEQCSDRIHRIGQTDDCNIYTVTLDTGDALNLSTRMDNILQWSKQMTQSVIKSTDDNENLDETHFEELLAANESSVLLDEFLYKKEDHPMNLQRRINLSFADLVTGSMTYNYREYRAKKLIPEDTIILESNTCLEAKELLENAKYPSTAVPNVTFEQLCDSKHFYVGLVTTRPIKPGELIRLPRIE